MLYILIFARLSGKLRMWHALLRYFINLCIERSGFHAQLTTFFGRGDISFFLVRGMLPEVHRVKA